MPGLKITNFKGIFEKGSKFDLPDVFAETCSDFVLTHEGMLRKREGYTNELLSATGGIITTGLVGNIINMFELVTGRSETTAPNEAVKYLCQTDSVKGKIYWWNEFTSTWIQLDNNLTDFRNTVGVVQKCVFLEENGAVRILAGNLTANKTLWWGWCGERFANAIMNNEHALYPVTEKFPTTASLATIPVAINSLPYITFIFASNYSGAGSPPYDWVNSVIDSAIKYITYRVSYQYDYKQWSPPSQVTKTMTLGWSVMSSRAHLYFLIPANSDQRLTGIKIYRKVSDSYTEFLDGEGAYNLIRQIDINEEYGTWDSPTAPLWPYNASYLDAVFDFATSRFLLTAAQSDDDALASDLYNNCLLLAQDSITGTTYTCKISDTISSGISSQYFQVSSTLDLVNGRTYKLKVVSAWQWNSGGYYVYVHVDDLLSTDQAALPELYDDLNITDDSYTTSNAKYGVMINGQTFYGNVYNNGETKEYLVTYGQLTPDGLFANDVHLKLNAFTAGRPIKGMSATGNRLLIYGDSFISRGIIPSGNEQSWTYEKLYDKFGLLADYSLVNINGKDYFLSTDWDVKVFDGVTPPVSIGGGIFDTIKGIGNVSMTYLRNTVGFFIPKLNAFGLRLQSGSSTYQYWLYDISHKLGWIKFAWHDDFMGFFNTRSGESIAHTSTGVFKLNSGTKDGASNINPMYKSLPLAASRNSILNLESLAYHMKSNTNIQTSLFLDDSTTPSVALTVASNTLDKLLSRNFPMGTQCRSVQVGVSIPNANLATNTQLDVDEIELALKPSGDKSA